MVRARNWIVATGLLGGWLLGCSSDSQGEAATDGSSTATSEGTDPGSSSSTTGPQDCSQCVAVAPQGWTGPVAISRTSPDGAPACAGDYAQDAGSFGETFEAGVAMCQCRCGAAMGIECSGPATACWDEGADSCTLGCDPGEATLMPGECTATMATGTEHGRAIMPDPVEPGSCEASEAHTLDAPTFGTAITACARAESTEAGCTDQEVCAPAPDDPFDRVCIFQIGVHECPDPYISRALVWAGFEDNRSCSECSCGPADSECGGSLENSDSPNCDNITSTTPANGCSMTFGEAFTRWNLTPSGTCAPSTAQLSGQANPIDQTTLCCLA